MDKVTKYAIRDLNDTFTFTTKGNQEDTIRWLDLLLDAVKKVSLMTKLNDIQRDCNEGRSQSDPIVFPNKFTMPISIINLVIKEFGLKIVEV